MTNTESRRLLAFSYAFRNRMRPTNMPPSRRAMKSMKRATGQVLRTSKVTTQVPLEKVFKKY